MATANRAWGEERIAAELRVKLGLAVSPRTVRRYMPSRPRTRNGASRSSLGQHFSRTMLAPFSRATSS